MLVAVPIAYLIVGISGADAGHLIADAAAVGDKEVVCEFVCTVQNPFDRHVVRKVYVGECRIGGDDEGVVPSDATGKDASIDEVDAFPRIVKMDVASGVPYSVPHGDEVGGGVGI